MDPQQQPVPPPLDPQQQQQPPMQGQPPMPPPPLMAPQPPPIAGQSTEPTLVSAIQSEGEKNRQNEREMMAKEQSIVGNMKAGIGRTLGAPCTRSWNRDNDDALGAVGSLVGSSSSDSQTAPPVASTRTSSCTSCIPVESCRTSSCTSCIASCTTRCTTSCIAS